MKPLPPAGSIRARAALAALLGLALFAEVNDLARRHHTAADWSRGAVFTLSPTTRSTLEQLRRPVTLTAVVAEGGAAGADGRAEILRRVLERYAESADRITVRFVDPDRDPAAFAELLRRHRFLLERALSRRAALAEGVLAEAGERAAFRTLDHLLPPPEPDDRRCAVPVAVEAGVTSAIHEATTERRATACLTEGHGEWDLAGPEAAALLRTHLESQGLVVRTIAPTAPGADLERCDALVVGGPSRDFLPRETQRLREALERGTRLLVLLDAAPEAGTPAAGLEDLLARAGIEASAAPARETDPGRTYDPGVPTLVVGAVAGGFPPLAALAGRPVALLQSAGLRGVGPTSPARAVVETADSTRIDGWDEPPALALAAETGRGGRIVVVGGSTLLYPPFAARGSTANLAVALAAVDWLTGREVPAAAPPVAAERVRLFLTPEALRLYWWWLVVGMPIAAVAAGMIVLRSRRRG